MTLDCVEVEDDRVGWNTETPSASNIFRLSFLRGRRPGSEAEGFIPVVTELETTGSFCDAFATNPSVVLTAMEDTLCWYFCLLLCSHPPTHSPIDGLSFLDGRTWAKVSSRGLIRAEVLGTDVGEWATGTAPSPAFGFCDEGSGRFNGMEDAMPSPEKLRARGTSSSIASVNDVFKEERLC